MEEKNRRMNKSKNPVAQRRPNGSHVDTGRIFIPESRSF